MFKLGLDPDRRRGYARLLSDDVAGFFGLCQCKIFRKGLALGSLGGGGWQIAEYEWEFNTTDCGGFLAIEIPPVIVRHMENANYVFEISVVDVKYEAIVSWMGIPSFREEDFISSGVDVIESAVMRPISDNNLGMLDELFGGGTLPQSHDSPDIKAGSNDSQDITLNSSMFPRRLAQKIRCHQCGDYRFDTKDSCPWCGSK